MKKTHNEQRIIALEIRRSCFGYALFGGSKVLLDWGATTPFPLNRSHARAQRRFLSLVKMCIPEVFVVRNARLSTDSSELLEFVKSEATRRSIPLYIMSAVELRQAFSSFAIKDKYDIAEVVTRIFPVLASRLPRRRKRWEKETHAMAMFDAVAIGFAYWQKDRNEPQSEM